MSSGRDDDAVRAAVLRAMARRLAASGRQPQEVNMTARLLELGLFDSEDLIDIILEVEERCDLSFDPDRLDLEAGLTLAGLVECFRPALATS